MPAVKPSKKEIERIAKWMRWKAWEQCEIVLPWNELSKDLRKRYRRVAKAILMGEHLNINKECQL